MLVLHFPPIHMSSVFLLALCYQVVSREKSIILHLLHIPISVDINIASLFSESHISLNLLIVNASDQGLTVPLWDD